VVTEEFFPQQYMPPAVVFFTLWG